jgi:hypothetical protein
MTDIAAQRIEVALVILDHLGKIDEWTFEALTGPVDDQAAASDRRAREARVEELDPLLTDELRGWVSNGLEQRQREKIVETLAWLIDPTNNEKAAAGRDPPGQA